MNKNGKTSGFLIFGVIAGILILSVIAYSIYNFSQTPIQITGAGGAAVGTGTGGCAVNPTLVYAVTDTLSPSTAIGSSTTTGIVYYRLNGAYTGTTAPTTKGSVEMILTNASYVGKALPARTIDCGSNLITDNLYLIANATETFYSDNGLTALVLNTANETSKGAGGAYNWKIHLQGTDKKSTGKQVFIVELSVPGNVSSVTMSGATSVAVPNGYTRQATNGYAAAFELPAIIGNTAQDFNLAVAAASAKTITGTVYTTLLGVQPFVETDGTFSDSGKAYDSVNTAKFLTSTLKNFIIV